MEQALLGGEVALREERVVEAGGADVRDATGVEFGGYYRGHGRIDRPRCFREGPPREPPYSRKSGGDGDEADNIYNSDDPRVHGIGCGIHVNSNDNGSGRGGSV